MLLAVSLFVLGRISDSINQLIRFITVVCELDFRLLLMWVGEKKSVREHMFVEDVN